MAFTLDRYGHLYEDRSDALADALDNLLDRAERPSDAEVRKLS